MTRKGSKDFFFEKKKQKTFESWAEPFRIGRSQYAKVFCFFFSKKKFLLSSLIVAAGPQPDQSCVDVAVGTAQSYECINQQLGTLAAQQHRAATPDAPPTATSPANVTGQFDEAATRNRLGRNFGHSVTPERPAYAPPSAPR